MSPVVRLCTDVRMIDQIIKVPKQSSWLGTNKIVRSISCASLVNSAPTAQPVQIWFSFLQPCRSKQASRQKAVLKLFDAYYTSITIISAATNESHGRSNTSQTTHQTSNESHNYSRWRKLKVSPFFLSVSIQPQKQSQHPPLLALYKKNLQI